MLNPAVSRNVTVTDPGNIYINNLNKYDAVSTEEKWRRFDSVELSADTDKIAAVPKELVGRISQEVRATTTIGDIEALRQAVSEGKYFPDPLKIAQKMLFHVEV